jgi:hypothetical protein
MRYYTVINESGIVLNVIEAADDGDALHNVRDAGLHPLTLHQPGVIVVSDAEGQEPPVLADGGVA